MATIGYKIGRFQFQGGTRAELEASELVLLENELALEVDEETGSVKMRRGNGKSKYADCPYIDIGTISVDSSPELLRLIKGPKGEPGEPMTYDDLTVDQKQELAEKVAAWFRDSVDDKIAQMKDLVFESKASYVDDMIYVLDPYIEAGEVKFKAKEIGKILENDFLKFKVSADKIHFRVKSSSKGIILLYSLTDEALQYAIHVYPNIKDYEIEFGKVVNEELIFTSVTMPEDKVSVVREEGFDGN